MQAPTWSAHYRRPHYNSNQDDNQNFDQRSNETICSSKDFSGCQPYGYFAPFFLFSVRPQRSWLLSFCCFRYNFHSCREYAMCRSSPDCTWCRRSSRKTVSVIFCPWQCLGSNWSGLPLTLIVERNFFQFFGGRLLLDCCSFWFLVLLAISPILGGLYRLKNICWQVRRSRTNHAFPGSVRQVEIRLFGICLFTVCLVEPSSL